MPLYDGTGSLSVFDAHSRDLGWGKINYTPNPVECWLWTGPEPDKNWQFGTDVNNEVAANDYLRTVIPVQSWVQVGQLARLVSAPVELAPQSTTYQARGYLLVLRVGTDATSPVLTWGYLDSTLFDEKTVTDPEILRITPSANGWYDVNIR